MLKRYGDKALQESTMRADELEAEGYHKGTAIWRLITNTVSQLTAWAVALTRVMVFSRF
jgi:hypothetical protein